MVGVFRGSILGTSPEAAMSKAPSESTSAVCQKWSDFYAVYQYQRKDGEGEKLVKRSVGKH